jgi:nucleoid-associated protein YgaU
MEYTASRNERHAAHCVTRTAARKRSRQHRQKRRERLLILAVAATVMIFVMIRTSSVSAKPSASEPKTRYYTSITIENHDTLWDIAGRYYNSSSENRRDYIRTVKKINGLTDSTIKTGSRLVIYYWADADSAAR